MDDNYYINPLSTALYGDTEIIGLLDTKTGEYYYSSDEVPVCALKSCCAIYRTKENANG